MAGTGWHWLAGIVCHYQVGSELDEQMRRLNVSWLLWLALILALAGSLRHVAWTFASLDGNDTMGWLQAVAVDTGLAALVLALMQRRRIGMRAPMLLVGIGVFSTISVYSNLVFGLAHQLAELPTWVQQSRPWVLAATLPLLVAYLAEVVGVDLSLRLRKAEREERAEERRAEPQAVIEPTSPYVCIDCEQGFTERQKYAVHRRWCTVRAANNGHKQTVKEIVND